MTALVTDDVLRSAQAGQAWALRAVYEEFSPRVLAYFTARGVRDAEDLTSEVFTTVLPRLTNVTGGPAGLRTFLFSVAHARYVDDVRRRARHPDPSPYDPTTDSRTSASAEDQALVALGDAAVRTLLAGLVPDQRDVLLLRVIGDLTVEQCAETLGKSVGAVKQLQRRGLTNLRAQMGDRTVPL